MHQQHPPVLYWRCRLTQVDLYNGHKIAVVVLSVLFSSSNIGEFSKDVRMLAALEETETDGDKLLDAARRLAGAFSELLMAAQPGSAEVS